MNEALILLYKIIYSLFYFLLIIMEKLTFILYIKLKRFNAKIENDKIDIHLKILTENY